MIGKHERRIRLSFAFAGSKMQIFDFTRAISKCLDFDRTSGVAKLIKSIKEETKGQTDEIFAHGGYCLMIIFDLNCRIFFDKDFEKEDSCPHIY